MAQLKDLLVTGDARVLGTVYADIPTNDLVPYAAKTYIDIIGNSSSNAIADNSFYFGSVKPNSFTESWEVRYRVRVWVSTNTNYEAVSDVLFKGDQSSINAYAIFNHFYSTSYRPVYYHTVARLKSAGFTAGYGHALGISLSDSNNRADTSLKRSFTVELIYAKNCTATLNDTAVLWANWTGTGSTNYNDPGTYNFSSNGLQETGDNDDTCQLRSYYERPLVDTGKLYGYNLCTLTSDDKLTGFVTSYSTGTSKTKNTATFKINAPIYYYNSSTEKAAGTYTSDNTLIFQTSGINLQYSTNCGTTLTANKPVYLVGVPSGTTYTLADTWWTQTLPTTADGKIYIYLGIAYSTYQIAWQINHPIYWYKDGAVKLYIPSAGDLAYINKGSGSSKYLREDGTWQTVSGGGTGTVTGVTAGAGLNTTSSDTATDGGTISTSGTLYLTKSGVTAGTYQGITVDKYGRVTSASNQGYVTTDTKNTAGSTDSSSKLFLVGATSQAANPQTYSQDTTYIGTDGHLYSNSKQTVNLSDSQALTNKTYNGYTLGAACAKAVVTSVDTSASLPTSNAVKTFVEGKGYTTNTGTITGVSINSTSIATSGVANIVTNSTYNSSSNKIATMSDVPSFTFTDVTVTPWD